MELRKRPLVFASLFLIVFSLFVRSHFLWLKNGDLLMNVEWYQFLQENGFRGLSNSDFSNYSPPYLYLLWFCTWLFPQAEPFLVIKLIPTLFDVFSAFLVYKIACIKLEGDKPIFASALFFSLPTIMFNSTGWGQVDSLYGSFLLLCFYFLLNNKSVPALVAFGIAISCKLQSIFFLPFLGILLLRGKIRGYAFTTIPFVYALAMLPAILANRSLQSILKVYADQAVLYNDLARYAPNLYFLIPKEYFHPVFEIGMGIFFISMLAWAWINWNAKLPITEKQLVLTALTSVALVPFLLPKMHDRYFYPADIFSFVTAIFIPELWFFALLFQISSGLVYLIFPFGMPPLLALPAALINSVLVMFIIHRQYRSLKES
jgi:Gpi18-like mannosyltransferase